MDSFIVGFWAGIFAVLSVFSPFQLARAVAPEKTKSYGFVDAWVLGNLVIAALCVLLSPPGVISLWEWIALIYGAVRVFETVVYQVNVLLFDEYRAKKLGKPYAVRGYRRLVVLAVQTYVEILLWFSLAFRNFHGLFQSPSIQLDSIGGSLYYSLVAIAGYGDITPIKSPGEWLVLCQMAVGLFMTIIVLARFVALLRSPATLDETETETGCGS
jgi:hypothetical protein